MFSGEEFQSHNHLNPVDFDMLTKQMGEFNVNAAIDLFHVIFAFCFSPTYCFAISQFSIHNNW